MATGQRLVVSIEGKEEVGFGTKLMMCKSQPGMANVLTEQIFLFYICFDVQEFPWVWLRDNCQCSQCFEAISKYETIFINQSPEKK